jgi:uncharacterized membrane protein YfcA
VAMHGGFVVWLFLVSLGASALGGAIGMASGIFIVPVLTLFSGLDIHAAVGASIVSVIACSCGGAAPFLRSGTTNIRVAIVLEVTTTLGALTGVRLAGLLSAPILYLLFGAVLMASAAQMISKRRDTPEEAGASELRDWASQLRLHSSYPDRGRDVFYRVRHVPLGLALMYGAGLLSALLGIGSGVLKVPAMDTALRLPIKVSSATSNFMIGVTAAASGVAYFARGSIDPMIAGPVALGSVLGAMLGARVLMTVSANTLRPLFVVALVGMAAHMLLHALGSL